MIKIIVKKNKESYIFVVVKKHKIQELIGVLTNNELTIDVFKLRHYIKLGCSFSKTAFNLIYKNLIKKKEIKQVIKYDTKN